MTQLLTGHRLKFADNTMNLRSVVRYDENIELSYFTILSHTVLPVNHQQRVL